MEKMVTISVRLSRDVAEALRRQARFEGVTVDSLVRACIDRNVRRSRQSEKLNSAVSSPSGPEREAAVDSAANGAHVYGVTGSQSL